MIFLEILLKFWFLWTNVFLVNFKIFLFLLLNKLEFWSFFDKLKKIISSMKENQIDWIEK